MAQAKKPTKQSAKKRAPKSSTKLDVSRSTKKVLKKQAAKTKKPEIAEQEVGVMPEEPTAVAEASVPEETIVVPDEVPIIAVEPEPSEASQKPRPSMDRRWLGSLAGVAVVLAGLIAFAIWHHARQKQSSVAEIVNEVSKVTVLPQGETPTVSTVIDKQQITQPFLANAQEGDEILLYYQAKKAIVYRPSTHQIVAIGPIAQGVARVFIRNGGVSTAALQNIQSEISQDVSDFNVVSHDDSPIKNYQSTVVVDVTGQRPDVAKKLASLIHAQVSTLPPGESFPDADMLVIVGKDAQ